MSMYVVMKHLVVLLETKASREHRELHPRAERRVVPTDDIGSVSDRTIAGLNADVAQMPVMTPPASGGRAKEHGHTGSRPGTPPSALSLVHGVPS